MNNNVWCCVGGGGSLTQSDVDTLRGRVRVIGVNDAYRIVPFADAIYAADISWWAVHWEKVQKNFAGRMYTVINGQDKVKPYAAHTLYGCQVFKQAGENEGLSRDPERLRLGSLSGIQAINLAYHWGAKVILLLGYDMQWTNGLRHWFGDHKAAGLRNAEPSKYLGNFSNIHPADYGIEIVNCSRQTALDHFPKMPLADALDKYAPA